jgi:hypothetical protein
MTLKFVKQQSGIPFLKEGMRVELSYGLVKKQGIIKRGNSSGNIDVLFHGQKRPNNCHPTWGMTYFNKEGKVIAKYAAD